MNGWQAAGLVYASIAVALAVALVASGIINLVNNRARVRSMMLYAAPIYLIAVVVVAVAWVPVLAWIAWRPRADPEKII